MPFSATILHTSVKPFSHQHIITMLHLTDPLVGNLPEKIPDVGQINGRIVWYYYHSNDAAPRAVLHIVSVSMLQRFSDDTSDTVLIENNGVASTPLSSEPTVSYEKSTASSVIIE